MVGTHSKKGGMATTGTGTQSAEEPREDQAGVGETVGGSLPVDGRDIGAKTATSDTAGGKERRRRKKNPNKNGMRPKGRPFLKRRGRWP